jgi:3-phenylpropionate/cinnamic acid dioxygenase small subunit
VPEPGTGMNIQQISDHLEITALLHRYARAVDTKDWALYWSVFTEDAHVDYSSAACPAGGRDDVTDWLSQAFEHLPMSQHYITDIEITPVTRDTATVRAMFYNPMQLPGMADVSYCSGYYHHDVVRTSDGWRSARLREDNAWFVNHPAGASA